MKNLGKIRQNTNKEILVNLKKPDAIWIFLNFIKNYAGVKRVELMYSFDKHERPKRVTIKFKIQSGKLFEQFKKDIFKFDKKLKEEIVG